MKNKTVKKFEEICKTIEQTTYWRIKVCHGPGHQSSDTFHVEASDIESAKSEAYEKLESMDLDWPIIEEIAIDRKHKPVYVDIRLDELKELLELVK